MFEARAEARRAEHVDEVVGQTVDENAPVVQVVNLILSQAVTERASDVHIEPMDDRLRIRNRVDGALHEVLSLPVDMGPALVSRIKVMANMNIVERRRPQDGQLEATIDGVPLDVRVSTTSTVQGEKCVLRILDKRRALFQLSDLGMPPDMLGTYEQLVRSPYGMVICAGPTGSGKTTTLYATLTADQQRRDQRDDGRGPGRVRLPDGQPDPDQRAGGRDVRRRAAVDPAPGPRRDPRG